MCASRLQVSGVTVEIGGRRIVDGVSFEASSGEITAIAGPNGAGKTTLMRAILGLQVADGSFLLDGEDLSVRSRGQRARAIAYVPQRSQLDTALTVEQVVSQGRYAHRGQRDDTMRAVDVSLNEAGIANLRARLFTTLSGGEQRLVLVARALCTGAQTLLLDEPTAWLDVANRLRLLALLSDLAARDRAIVCVLHDLQDVHRCADRVLLLHEGKVAAWGSAEEVVTAENVQQVYGVRLSHGGGVSFSLAEEK